MPQVAIIGAGAAGCAAAWALRDAPVACTLVEKSRGPTGRAATRRRDGRRYDHGANYFRTPTDRLRRLVTEQLPTDRLVDLAAAVWRFTPPGADDGSGGDGPDGDAAPTLHLAAPDDAPMWTYDGGISHLGRLLLDAAGAPTLRLQTRLERLARRADGWHLTMTDGATDGPYDAVLLTPPAPQARALVAASAMDDALRDRLTTALGAARYARQFTFVYGYDRRLARPDALYGLRAEDPAAAPVVAWVGFEDAKPGRVPAGASLLVVQTAPGWTDAHFEDDRDALAAAVRPHVDALLAAAPLALDAPPPAWHDHHRWRYSLPTAPADADALEDAAPDGLFFAGDAIAGTGRVSRALASGLDAAARLQAHL
jgi:predicted NAD/FAD-dependent oxidoreductase